MPIHVRHARTTTSLASILILMVACTVLPAANSRTEDDGEPRADLTGR